MRWLLLIYFAVFLNATAWSNPLEEGLGQPPAARDLVSQFSGQLNLAKDKASDQASSIVTQAMGLLGVPYRYGGTNEVTGFDCSGLVRHLYEKSVGQLLPRRAVDQARATDVIDRKELQVGDLVFFNTMRRAFSHVGMYLGDGKFIHAPRPGQPVRIEDMRTAYWKKRFNGARRVPLDSEPTNP